MKNNNWDQWVGQLIHITFREPKREDNQGGIRSIRGRFKERIDEFICIQTKARKMMINSHTIIKIQEENEHYNDKESDYGH